VESRTRCARIALAVTLALRAMPNGRWQRPTTKRAGRQRSCVYARLHLLPNIGPNFGTFDTPAKGMALGATNTVARPMNDRLTCRNSYPFRRREGREPQRRILGKALFQYHFRQLSSILD
jgi:hypothetical protein